MADFHPMLDRILAAKAGEVQALLSGVGLAGLERAAKEAPAPRDFRAALLAAPGPAVIAEIKRRSPSAGELRAGASPAGLARAYQASGAAALSVLTDGPFFGGSLADLAAARAACSLPVLRKDFIIHEAQVYEARAAGADAVLLIAAALRPDDLARLHRLAGDLGMAALVEVHRSDEIDAVLAAGPKLIGINNRDLSDFRVDTGVCLRLRPLIPADVTVVAESGISRTGQIDEMRRAGLDAFLVGSALMRAPDPGRALARLLETENQS